MAEGEALPPLPPMGGLRFLAAALLTVRRPGRGEVDGREMRFAAAPLDRRQWRAFAAALDYPPGESPPLGFLFLLAQRAQVALMLAPGFPFPLPGLIHVAHEMQRAAALDPAAPLELACSAGSEGNDDSTRIELQVRFEQQRAVVAECRSTYLARRRTAGAARAPKPEAPASLDAVHASYPLGRDAGRRYARLSGDGNPIHLWRWSARLFGLRRPIIHGMHTVSSVEAALGRAEGRHLARIAAAFRRPIALPSQVVVHARDGRFQACVGGEVCVDGSYAFAS